MTVERTAREANSETMKTAVELVNGSTCTVGGYNIRLEWVVSVSTETI